MSARRSPRKASRKSGREAFSTAIYVYCVGALEELAPLFEGDLPSPIQSPASLEIVAEGDLAAVVSAVPLADYGEEVIQERLSDPAWVAEHAMRHELVVEHFARRANVIPLRFGTIYLSREAVGKMLGEKGRPLRATLVLLDGREEWGVNVYVDRAQLRQSVAEVS
ncbi:MAG TPA: GvpL/GvpF family gas vesicle protein, partial [Pyrinomonadaceae bacterium]|nr:GvpL/GvpF family gas vesicle protein [Pyrinomonadaceae bacterium]